MPKSKQRVKSAQYYKKLLHKQKRVNVRTHNQYEQDRAVYEATITVLKQKMKTLTEELKKLKEGKCVKTTKPNNLVKKPNTNQE